MLFSPKASKDFDLLRVYYRASICAGTCLKLDSVGKLKFSTV